jgi:phage terminase small subunit
MHLTKVKKGFRILSEMALIVDTVPIESEAERPAKVQTDRAGKTGLSMKERAFVDAYADTSKPSFGIGVQAAMSAGYGGKSTDWQSVPYQTAHRAAVNLLKKPKIQSEIERIFSQNKLTIEDRSRVVSDILHSPTKETVHETYDKEGNLTTKQIITSSNASERLRAVDIASKMDGLYTKAADVSRLQARVLQPMLEHYSRLMRKALQATVEGQGEMQEPIDVSTVNPPDSDASTLIADGSVVDVDDGVSEQESIQAGDEW